MKDEHVKAVVLRVDSPGGSVSGSDYIYHHLRKLAEKRKIPIVVSMGGIAASGGYYVSMAVGHEPDTIFAEPTGFTGSIGVIIPHYNIAGFMDKYKVWSTIPIASKPLKEMGSITKPMTPEEKEDLPGAGQRELRAVQGSRPRGPRRVREGPGEAGRAGHRPDLHRGAGRQKQRPDRQVGFMEDAVDRAIELANLDKDKVKVVRYKPEPSLSSILLGGAVAQVAAGWI